MPQRRQVDMGEEERPQGAGCQVMENVQGLESAGGEDQLPQRRDIHQQDAGQADDRHQDEHDGQVGRLLHRIELVVRSGMMRVGPAEEIEEEVEEHLAQQTVL